MSTQLWNKETRVLPYGAYFSVEMSGNKQTNTYTTAEINYKNEKGLN